MNKISPKTPWGQGEGRTEGETTSVTSVTSDHPPSSEEWSPPGPLAYVPDPLPLDGFPGWFRAHAESVAAATQTPPDMAVGFGLAALATATAGRVCVRIEEGWTEPTNLYLGIVAEPGSGKSPVFDHMMAPIKQFERELFDRGHQDARVFVQDITAEKLGQVMAANGERTSVLAPEGDFFNIVGGRYSDGRATLGLFKQAWSGEAFRDDRISRDGAMLAEPLITVGIATQPHVMERIRLRDDFRQEGLLGRFVWICPEDLIGRRLTGPDKPVLDSAAADRYRGVLGTLLRSAGSWAPGHDSEAATLTFSAAAREAFHEFSRWAESMRVPGGTLREIREWSTKLEVQAIRIAALVEIALRAEEDQFTWTGEIRPAAMKAAIQMCRALVSHAQVALDIVRPDPALDDARHLLEKLRRYTGEDPPTLHWLQRHSGPQRLRGSNRLVRQAAELLEERGYVRLIERKSNGGRPPSPLIKINPRLRCDRSDESLSGGGP